LIIAVDQAYKYALVAGNNLDYLWILSREKTIPEEIRHSYLQKAKELGYQTQDLVWTSHD
jgi:apolipoprotein D and lipocalin family protein